MVLTLKVLSLSPIAVIASRLMIQWRVGSYYVWPHTLDTPNVHGVISRLWLVNREVISRASFHMLGRNAFALIGRLPLDSKVSLLAELNFAKRI